MAVTTEDAARWLGGGQDLTAPGASQQMVALIETADEMVDDYASGAPATIRDHAVRMLVGYLYNDRGYAERRPRWGANAMRNSGAASLLAPYRVAQALVAG